MPVSGRPHATRTAVHKIDERAGDRDGGRFADDFGRGFRELIDQIVCAQRPPVGRPHQGFSLQSILPTARGSVSIKCVRIRWPCSRPRVSRLGRERSSMDANVMRSPRDRLILILIIKALGRDISSERFAHCRKGQ